MASRGRSLKAVDLQEHYSINGIDVYVVQSHHHVLIPWSLVRSGLTLPPNLITLDHHTDTSPPFLRHICRRDKSGAQDDESDELMRATLLNAIDWRYERSVQNAIDLLTNDEHIQTATGSGIIYAAFILQLVDSDGTSSMEQDRCRQDWPNCGLTPVPARPFTCKPPEGNAFIVPHSFCVLGTNCTKPAHDLECAAAHYDQVLEASYLSGQLDHAQEMAQSIEIPELEEAPYILDIDLDFFHTKKAIEPHDPSVFYRLIRNAKAITIAIEEDYTLDLQVANENLSCATLKKQLADSTAKCNGLEGL